VRENVGGPRVQRLVRGTPALDLLRAARAAAAGAVHLRARGVTVGRTPLLYGRRPVIGGGGTIEIGDDFRCDAAQFRASLTAAPGATLRLGDAVFVNQGATIHAASSVRIGHHVLVGDLVAIYDTDFHEVEPGAGVRVAPVVLEDNVWLGRGAIVLPGVTVGRNTVVAAGSVVTRTVPPDHVVGGNPAVPLRPLRAAPDWIRQPLRRATLR
jgi:acetyltransferase-like isoleucine patch superfamily enzyme